MIRCQNIEEYQWLERIAMLTREDARAQWLSQVFDSSDFSVEPLAGDASFRQYYRIQKATKTFVLMDAPPEKEAITPFMNVSSALYNIGLTTPVCYHSNEPQGFLLLDDFGNTLFEQAVSKAANPDPYYYKAIDTLIILEQCPLTLPVFDKESVLAELALLPQWFFMGYLKRTLTQTEQAVLHDTFHHLAESIHALPRVFMHKDYHSRNIMIISDNPLKLGVIDFQDAMQGPIGYDLVSLLKDCYLKWPEEKITQWVSYYYEHTTIHQLISLEAFLPIFHLCGFQRHLKVLGIFSRLALRDNKPHYLKQMPLVLNYVLDYLKTNDLYRSFYELMQTVQLP